MRMRMRLRLIFSLAAVVAALFPVVASGRDNHVKNVAALTTVYRHNSHGDIIISRLLQTDTLDGKGKDSPLKLVSLYTDQVPSGDTSRMLSASHRFPIFDTIEGALTLGTGKLAVDGVLLVVEHGNYPVSASGSTQYPKRRFWEAVFKVFRDSGRVVPVFHDKHIADNWTDAKFIYDNVKELKIPLMAGSSLPTTWRRPAADVRRGAKLKEIVALTFGSTDHYGFHALEFVQALAEQRAGGETGIVAAQCLTGDAVWKAKEEGRIDPHLFRAAWERQPRRLAEGREIRDAVPNPILFALEYADGLRVNVIELNGAIGEWSGAWRYADTGEIESSMFWTQEGRPGMHFTILLNGIEEMMLTEKPSWPAERTLMTSGALDAILNSRFYGGVRLPTPHLEFSYQHAWRWKEPPPPPPTRPWSAQ
jgi:hypothetical protein